MTPNVPLVTGGKLALMGFGIAMGTLGFVQRVWWLVVIGQLLLVALAYWNRKQLRLSRVGAVYSVGFGLTWLLFFVWR